MLDAKGLADPRFKANPYPFYARMRAESPVVSVAVPFYKRAWLVTRYDDVVAMLRDDRFSKDVTSRMRFLPGFARPFTEQMLNRDPPDHTRLRGLVSKAFTPARIEQLRGRVQEVANRLLEKAPSEGFDVVEHFALPLPLTVIADLLGIPEADRRRFHGFVRGSLPIGAPTRLLDLPLSLPYLWLLTRYFRKIFDQRRASPRDDLLSALVQAEEAGDRLSEDELLGMALLLLFAGYETTVNLVSSAALALLQHPEQRRRFSEDPTALEPAIEELLRYTSPVEMTPPRITREDVAMRGVTIPKRELVTAVLGSANRDETAFPDPDTLDLTRHPNRHVALGVGAHFCLGASLARMEGRIALSALFRRFPDLRLAVPAEELRWRPMVPLRGLAALPVTVQGP